MRANRVPFTLAIAAVLVGCVSFPAPTPDKAPVSLENVESEISESQLLDVQIAIFDPGELPSRESRARGLSEDVRKAEAVFIPTHLRNTLQRTGHWGAVRVVPAHTSSAELLLSGRILDSNGETLELEIEVRDATGTEWFKETFESNVALGAYEVEAREDVFQNVYHEIANFVAAHRMELSAEEIRRIRNVAEMRFGQHIAPTAFTGYLYGTGDNVKLERLPSEDDPMLARVRRVRERDYLLVDTLDSSHDTAYLEMEEIYTEWRRAWLEETNMIRDVEQRKVQRQQQAAVLLIFAILAGAALSTAPGYNPAAVAAVTAGSAAAVQLMIQAENIMEEAEINKAALEELSTSIGADVSSIVIDVEGETIELSGSAEAKYEQWREILAEFYEIERGAELPAVAPHAEANFIGPIFGEANFIEPSFAGPGDTEPN